MKVKREYVIMSVYSQNFINRNSNMNFFWFESLNKNVSIYMQLGNIEMINIDECMSTETQMKHYHFAITEYLLDFLCYNSQLTDQEWLNVHFPELSKTQHTLHFTVLLLRNQNPFIFFVRSMLSVTPYLRVTLADPCPCWP